jgi:hypothetical protein
MQELLNQDSNLIGIPTGTRESLFSNQITIGGIEPQHNTYHLS